MVGLDLPDVGKGGGKVNDEGASEEGGACEGGHFDYDFEFPSE